MILIFSEYQITYKYYFNDISLNKLVAHVPSGKNISMSTPL